MGSPTPMTAGPINYKDCQVRFRLPGKQRTLTEETSRPQRGTPFWRTGGEGGKP